MTLIPVAWQLERASEMSLPALRPPNKMNLQKRIFASLPLLAIAKSHGQDILRYRFQYYDEEDGRIDVEAHYLDYKHTFDTGTTLGVRYAIDSLSGETPVGTHAPLDDTDWNFQEIDDRRKAFALTVEQELDDYILSFEYAHSKESDYVSDSVALRLSRDLFDKNTTLTGGVSFAADTVLATPFTIIDNDRDKDSFDLSFGLSQILGPNTVVDFNVGYGHSKGYLADAYRQISQTSTIIVSTPFGEFPVTDTFDYPENRPDSIDRWVAKAAVKHYVEPLHGAFHGSYRFFANSDSLIGHTIELKWVQEVGDKVSVSPFFRYYIQSEADFYHATLTDTGIDGHGRNDGDGPYYSSDYRLSAMEAFTYGVSVSYSPVEDLTLDLQLERYEMSGRDSATPDIFFPSATILSLGAQWSF